MSFVVEKQHGELIFTDHGGYQSRNPSTIWCIEQADALYQWPDFGKILIHTGDVQHDSLGYAYSRMSYDKLIPDFNFHAWPQAGIDDYTKFVADIDAAGRMPAETNKVGWIGNIATSSVRRNMFSVAYEHELFDLHDCGNWWGSPDSVKMNCNGYISTPDLVKQYSILIDVEGAGYSGRVKHLLWSHRPLLFVDRPFKEYFLESLKEWVHYIPVKRDLSDLVEKAQWCAEHYDEALKIAEHAYQFATEHLTREACYKKWNTIIQNVECV